MGENGHRCVCMADFLHCSPETTPTLLIDYESESEVGQSSPTLCAPVDCTPPCSSVRVNRLYPNTKRKKKFQKKKRKAQEMCLAYSHTAGTLSQIFHAPSPPSQSIVVALCSGGNWQRAGAQEPRSTPPSPAPALLPSELHPRRDSRLHPGANFSGIPAPPCC